MIKYDEDSVREKKSIAKLEPLERNNFEELHNGSRVLAKYKSMGMYHATVEKVILPKDDSKNEVYI